MEQYKYMKPIEMPRSMCYGNNYHLVPSRKVGRVVRAFSDLEYENIISLEMNPDVEYFCEQPLRTTVVYEGDIIVSTVFDVYVHYKDGTDEMQEVKWSDEINDGSDKGERAARQISVQKTWCENNGFRHVIRTEETIAPGEHYIENLIWLAARSRNFKKKSDDINNKIDSLLYCINTNEKASISQLVTTGAIELKGCMEFLANLFYLGKITFEDIENTVINGRTEVMIRESKKV